jgi:inosine-uridine nucleoside N-ribohydrolase
VILCLCGTFFPATKTPGHKDFTKDFLDKTLYYYDQLFLYKEMIMKTVRWFVSILMVVLCLLVSAQTRKVWLDADTGNETDGVYAIARLLAEPSVNVLGLSSAHFNNADLVSFEKWNQYSTVGIKTVEISQQINEAILKAMGKTFIPHPMGADRQIGRAWGGTTPRKSGGSDGIIAAVKNLKPGEKLDVLCIGALTNIASAIILDPSIIPSIRCFSMGASYYLKKNAWSKNEFNIHPA